MNVRDILPERRTTLTRKPRKNWALHKDDLQVDFNNSCAYCGSYDGYKHTYFEVDHFIPKDFIIKNKLSISLVEYSNLVYSCKFCNNNKLDKWPSQSQTVSHLNDKGFIDPCDAEYNNHLYRTSEGAILWKSDLGEWMAKEAFHFDIREKGIKILFELNQRRILIDKYALELSKMNPHSSDYNEAKSKAGEAGLEYALIHKELINYYNNL